MIQIYAQDVKMEIPANFNELICSSPPPRNILLINWIIIIKYINNIK